jgi:hypothetical protein
MSKMIIENIMGGKLFVHSTPEGAEFTIETAVVGCARSRLT